MIEGEALQGVQGIMNVFHLGNEGSDIPRYHRI
jgi:hypothetical protein